ncbi:NB-ARC domain-containing protein [Synechococcus sp. PCC 7502]|uniref:NB-ARC domain-containing protein n=1 Tax=Synechococcus sp. PCC 7502 TaxID=1173263 RepID=UPI00029FB00B|nr:NB-ARC domain-containing protein [Synechococcus sp. PCC 7502]AFY73623.1 NB-ARC domain-containing protein [Synechococcus sp. PCC 7502]
MTNADNFSSLFTEAEQAWHLEKLYADLEKVNHKPLKSMEKACLRGLLCRYRPGQLAFKLSWTSGALRVELNKGLYRYIEELTAHPPNTLKWEVVGDWLADNGYKKVESSRRQDIKISGKQDWGEAPEITTLLGREDQLQELERYIISDHCREICLWGMGGIGKTALAVKLAEQLQGEFTYLIWRSLKYIPPLNQLLADLCRFLPNSDPKLEELSQFIEILKNNRCLIIIDDFEATLQDGELVGSYRQGYSDYGQFLERLGIERHQSCILVISREQPKQISLLQSDSLRSYKLQGLEKQGAIALLKTKGFAGDQAGIDQLIQQYRGNPAALKIVASTINELFDCNISAFLKQTALVLGDVLQTLLYEQFERLSHLEKDVIYWLAIKRRPTSVNDLRSVMPNGGAELLNALESLRWRSLIEKVSAGEEVLFLLEPVLTKYVNKKFLEQVSQEIRAIAINQNLSSLKLLHSHSLVEDFAPDTVRAAQIRMTLKPLKDTLVLINQSIDLTQVLAKSFNQGGYVEVNMTLLGIWI